MSTTYDCGLGREGNGPYRLLRAFHDRLVEDFLADLADPEAAQRRRFELLMLEGRGTAFGQAHDLDRVRTLEDFRSAVPIRDGEAFRPWLDRVARGERSVLTIERVRMLLETSGTSGRPRHLPVTPTWERTVARAQALWLLGLVRDLEAAARGKALTVVSAAVHARSPGGLPIGSNTGRMYLAQPWWVRLRYPVPYRVFCLKPQTLRQYAVLRFALQAPITTWTTANPSTILLLSRRLLEWREELARDLADGTLRHGPAAELDSKERRRLERRLKRRRPPADDPAAWIPARLWPLAGINCWKAGPSAYFASRLPQAIGADLPVREVGITASEGYFAVPLGADWDSGVLWTGGHLMEFVGEDGEPRWAWELEEGDRVRLVVTTEAGLYRYDLGDMLDVVGFSGRTPVVRFAGKAGRFLNVTGERVSEGQVSAAVHRAAAKTGIQPVGFTARVQPADQPAYELALELPSGDNAEAARFVEAFDRALGDLNVEYEGKRSSGRILPPRAVLVPPGTYVQWRAARVEAGAPEGQVKDPITALDEAEWRAVVGRSGGCGARADGA